MASLENPQSEFSSSWKWHMSALTSENAKGVSNMYPISPRLTASTEAGPQQKKPPLSSCGVESTICQPPYPGGRSGRAIHTSFHTWKFQQESLQSPSGPFSIRSPKTSKYLKTQLVRITSKVGSKPTDTKLKFWLYIFQRISPRLQLSWPPEYWVLIWHFLKNKAEATFLRPSALKTSQTQHIENPFWRFWASWKWNQP